MTCKHCKKPIIRCESAPSHFGCSSAYGYVHDDSRAHGCQPRSDGPYAEPERSMPDTTDPAADVPDEAERIHDERCCMTGNPPGLGPHPDCPGYPYWPDEER